MKSTARTQFAEFLQYENIEYKEGLIVTGDSFIGSQAQKNDIRQNFAQALGVEMEGTAFAQVAYHFNKPLIALRAISDNGNQDANEDFNQFAQKVGAKAAKIICTYIEKMNS